MQSTNDGSMNPPALKLYMSMFAIDSMPQFAGHDRSAKYAAIKDAGFHGIQFSGDEDKYLDECRALGLGIAQSGRINRPNESDDFAQRFAGQSAECATVHLGWGFEDDEEGLRLIHSVLEASAKHGIPIYPETHRATIFQDMWRTLQFAKRIPELKFNADYSHWYTGSEMVNGKVEWKLDLLEHIFDRVRFMHGRIGDPGCIQVPVLGFDDHRPFVDHFREFWTRTFRAFLRDARPGDYLCFSPEILPANIFYARTVTNISGEVVETSDRWQQSLLLNEIAKDCFTRVQQENL